MSYVRRKQRQMFFFQQVLDFRIWRFFEPNFFMRNNWLFQDFQTWQRWVDEELREMDRNNEVDEPMMLRCDGRRQNTHRRGWRNYFSNRPDFVCYRAKAADNKYIPKKLMVYIFAYANSVENYAYLCNNFWGWIALNTETESWRIKFSFDRRETLKQCTDDERRQRNSNRACEIKRPFSVKLG